MALVAASAPAASAFAADPEAGGSPSILTGDIGNVFWTLLIFICVLVVLRKFAWNPILQALNAREKFIADSLASAQKDRQEAEQVLKDYSAKIDKAREDATEIVEEGRRDAEVVQKRIQAEARQEADAMLTRAKREIEIARDNAVKELYDQTVSLATSVAGKIVRRELTAGDHRGLLEESLAEMGRLRE